MASVLDRPRLVTEGKAGGIIQRGGAAETIRGRS